MIEEDTIYWRALLAPLDGWNERVFCALVAWWGIPFTYLDLGSGTGAMVNIARKLGVEAYGVDLVNGPEHWFIEHDLRTRLNLVRIDHRLFDGYTLPPHVYQAADADTERFQLVTCLEVAEHLPEESAEILCETIASHLLSGGRLVFSAAPPGQQGEHHVNCQPASYWRSKLYQVGVSYREDYTQSLSHLLTLVAGPMQWLAANVQVFDR